MRETGRFSPAESQVILNYLFPRPVPKFLSKPARDICCRDFPGTKGINPLELRGAELCVMVHEGARAWDFTDTICG